MKNLLLLMLMFCCANVLFSQNVTLFGKFETEVEFEANYSNPFDYDEIAVSATFSGPDGSQKEVDGFYLENYELDTISGALIPLGEGFKIRFAPDQVGPWNYEITKTDSTGTSIVTTGFFECTAITHPKNHGFVRKNESNYLNFDDGEQYILIGENMAWQVNNTVSNYRAWVSRLAQFGGNFFRLWHAHWGLGIEWKEGWNGFEGLRQYQQIKSRYQDWLYDYCADNGVYVMLCIQHHGQVSTNVNPNWNDSPYNVANGGPCQNTWDFFTDSLAIAHTKNRLRYIVARWGYSKNIMAWELFNEVEWTDNFDTHRAEIADWHFEMTDYLKSIDPYEHLLTTSYAHDDLDEEVWSYPEIDLTQTHFYNDVPNLEKVLAGGVRSYLNDFGKPTLTGEFGLGGNAELANEDPDGIHLHNALWGALMAGGMGTGMTWWWDNYVHPRDLYFHFSGVETFTRYVPFMEKKLKPGNAYVTGTVGDLNLVPGAGWGTVGTDSITIDTFGQTIPANMVLGQYLYGAQWNTGFRSPPVFSVEYPEDGFFAVNTSSGSGQAPRLVIWVDSVKMVDTMATANSSYRVDINAGVHSIRVDNRGIDWISIAGYKFSDLGSRVDSYVLTGEDNDYAAGWILNNEYNHVYVRENGNPLPSTEAMIHLPEFQTGDYFVTWLDCLTGDILGTEPVAVADSGLIMVVPELFWDAAFVVDVQEVVAVSDIIQNTFKLYPNPVRVGAAITLTDLETEGALAISLIDMAGRNVQEYGVIDKDSPDKLTLAIPGYLMAGMYWLKIANDQGRVMARPVMVGR